MDRSWSFFHFDYSVINLMYLGVIDDSDVWDKSYQTSYTIRGNNQWQEGYLQFRYNDTLKTKTKHTILIKITLPTHKLNKSMQTKLN